MAVTADGSGTAVSTVAEDVAVLRHDLGLAVSDIAEWMGVTRPAVYGWLKDVHPQPKTARQLAALSTAVKPIADLKLHRSDHVIKRPLFDGRSALDLLRSGQSLSTEQLLALHDLDAREERQRQAYALGRPVRSLADVAADSAPVMRS